MSDTIKFIICVVLILPFMFGIIGGVQFSINKEKHTKGTITMSIVSLLVAAGAVAGMVIVLMN